jgi:hypothetical protein
LKQLNFKTLDEVNIYLSMQEKRISDLEEINRDLIEKIKEEYDTHKEIVEIIDDAVPNSSILSDNFFTRAFSIWVHFFVAQLIIGLVIGVFYLLIILLFAGSIKTNF